MLIIEKKDALSELLKSENTVESTNSGYIRAVADIRRRKIALNSLDFPSLAKLLVDDGSDEADLYDLAITTYGKVFFSKSSQKQKEVNSFTARIIQQIVSSLLIFDQLEVSND